MIWEGYSINHLLNLLPQSTSGNLQELGTSILKGQVKGRVVIDVNA